jgi:hypothetical protein
MKMKKLFTLLLIVFFTAHAVNLFAEPMPVKVISSNFDIGGQIYGFDSPPIQSSFSDGYNESGSVPLSNSAANNGTQASSLAGFFSVSAFAVASVNGATYASARAGAEWIFQPLSPMDHITIYSDAWSGGGAGSVGSGHIVLTDITDAIAIFNRNFFYYWWDDYPYSDLILHSFQTNHVYLLYLWTEVATNYDPAGATIWTNDMIPEVPEPTTMLLLGLGLMALAGARRVFQI